MIEFPPCSLHTPQPLSWPHYYSLTKSTNRSLIHGCPQSLRPHTISPLLRISFQLQLSAVSAKSSAYSRSQGRRNLIFWDNTSSHDEEKEAAQNWTLMHSNLHLKISPQLIFNSISILEVFMWSHHNSYLPFFSLKLPNWPPNHFKTNKNSSPQRQRTASFAFLGISPVVVWNQKQPQLHFYHTQSQTALYFWSPFSLVSSYMTFCNNFECL